jgi:SMI1 / KNR4 family (SUKH-1)
MTKLVQLVDQFAGKLSSSGVQINQIDSAPWIEVFERKLPRSLPSSFRLFVTRYSFECFDLGGVTFFGNTGRTNNGDDLVVASLGDKYLSETLLPAGYIQIGQPETGDYDPICFDTNKPAQNREFPIVRINHEEVLCNYRIKITEQIADSFFRLIEDFLRGSE